MPKIFKRRVTAIGWPYAYTRRYLECMYQRHAQYLGIKIDRHFHVVGIERQVVNAATEWCCTMLQAHGMVGHTLHLCLYEVALSGVPECARSK